eukprot:6177874-Pleurochrysis_carterae.AAC.1
MAAKRHASPSPVHAAQQLEPARASGHDEQSVPAAKRARTYKVRDAAAATTTTTTTTTSITTMFLRHTQSIAQTKPPLKQPAHPSRVLWHLDEPSVI